MAVSKVVYRGEVLVDLTEDTVTASSLKKGITAHDSMGEPITGTFEPGTSLDDIDCILAHGFAEGTSTFAEDGAVTSRDSTGRMLVRTFSDDFKTCTSVLTDVDGAELGKMVKTYGEDFAEATITDRHGNKTVKKFVFTDSGCETLIVNE